MQAPPREVPDYTRAVASGLVRPVPASPPPLLPGPTARLLCRRWILSIVVTAVAFIAAFTAINHLGAAHHGLRSLLLFLTSMGALGFVVWGLSRVGHRNVAELD